MKTSVKVNKSFDFDHTIRKNICMSIHECQCLVTNKAATKPQKFLVALPRIYAIVDALACQETASCAAF